MQTVVCNLLALLRQYGHVPNGSRTYYINRRRASLLACPFVGRDLPSTDIHQARALSSQSSTHMFKADLKSANPCRSGVYMNLGVR